MFAHLAARARSFAAALALYRDFRAFRARLMRAGAAYETKDAGIADLLKKQGEAFEEFKKENSRRLAEIEKKGAADAVTSEKVEKLGKALDDIADQIKAAVKRADDLEAKFNRPGAGPSGAAAEAERKALADYNVLRVAYAAEKGRDKPAPLTIEQFRAGKAAFVKMLRYGEKELAGEDALALKAMSVGSDPDGGYLVPSDMSGRIVQRLFETSPIRQIADVQVTSRDAIEGIEDVNDATLGGWVGETGTRSDSATPQIGKWRIPVHEHYAQPKATRQILDDAVSDIEAWLVNKVADKLARAENTAFVSGDGVARPKGFTVYPTAATADSARTWGTFEHVASGTNGSLGVGTAAIEKLVDVAMALKPAFRQNATWVMSRASVAAVRKLKDAAGNYAWLPSMNERQPATLLGYPLVEAEDMPALSGTGSLGIAFGDFKQGYQIVDRQGIRLLRDELTDKPYVKFYTTKRVGGGAVNYDAIKFVKTAA